MKNWSRGLAAALIMLLLAASCATTPGLKEASGQEVRTDAFEQDRKAILAMAGKFKVTFDFRETLTLDPSTTPSKHDETEGMELVLVLEDRGGFISLQHLLVVDDDKPVVIKHWRQDWQYQDQVLHEFAGHLTWKPRHVTPEEVRGTWSQTVFQVDDSPRYEGFGAWRHVGGYSYWESNETWRPLPRREHTVRKDYDVLVGRNRHAITPTGWTHEQDNSKMVLRDGERRIIARESGLNTYVRDDAYDFSAAQAYWDKTSPFWKQVREVWAGLYAKGVPLHIEGNSADGALWRDVVRMAGQYADAKPVSHEEIEKTITEALVVAGGNEPAKDKAQAKRADKSDGRDAAGSPAS
ncbi:MAG: hypothetical protein K1Y02_25725 [Candidatus Hydrogenedentes bacterium]|nr:hypothetical protein [Candidatus Hydrogenedentota bacterium]